MLHLKENMSPDGEFALQVNVGLALRPADRAPLSNKELTAMLREGKSPADCEEVRISHNVLVDTGRAWLRNHICANAFPSPYAADVDLASASILPTPAGPPMTYRVRWIALGIGGTLQTTTPPGAGSFIEDRAVTGLENPYSVSGTGAGTTLWMGEVVPVTALGSTDVLPDATTARFRTTFSAGMIAYPGSQAAGGQLLGTDVPISEAALLTSQAAPYTAPTGNSLTPVSGLLAYNIFRTIPVTPNFDLEIAWDLRF